MKRFLRLAGALYAVLVIWGLSFAGTQLRASSFICDGAGVIGECPPYTDETCNEDCAAMFQTHGECHPGAPGGPWCCMCAV